MSFLTADLCDAHADKLQILELPLRSYGGKPQFHGPMSTIKAYEDNSKVREAVAEAGEGRVLVVDGGGSRRRAMLGDNLAQKAVDNGWAGVIVYGCIRDSAEIGTMPLGVLAVGTCPMKTEKRGLGDRDVPVRFGGIELKPGSWIYADEDGVICSETALD